MDKSKLIWPITVVISSVILAWSFYVVQQDKSASIERQQYEQLQIEKEKTKIESEKLSMEKSNKQKEYISKRKKDCLEIYTNEWKKWTNVNSWSFIEKDDACIIQYRNEKWKTWTPEIGVWNEKLEVFENPRYFTSSF